MIDIGDRLGRWAHSEVAETASCQFVHLADHRAIYSLDVDVVIHLAALPHVDYSIYHPETVFLNNVLATTSVAGAVRKIGIPLLFASSIEVYGGNTGAQFCEDDRLIARSPYAASKIASESLLDSYRSCFGLQATTIRLTNLYGPWQAPDRIIPRVILQALLGRRSEIVPGRTRDILHVTDAISAIFTIIDGGYWGQTFNISTGVGMKLEEVADVIVGTIGKGSYITVPAPPTDRRGESLVASPARLISTTGWKPMMALQEGITQTASWYCANRGWWSDLESLVHSGLGTERFLVDHARPIQLP